MGHVSNKPDQQRHFMPLSMPVRNISYVITELNTVAGGLSSGAAINNEGQVAGYSGINVDNLHAALWQPNGAMLDLGTLPSGGNSFAYAINNFGQVVGQASVGGTSQAFSWQDISGMTWLN